MKLPVLRTQPYREDLIRVWDFHVEWSGESADRVVREIQAKVDLLSDFPGAGESCPEFGSLCRRTLAGRYVIYYEVYSDRVEVLRVFHSAQQVDRLT